MSISFTTIFLLIILFVVIFIVGANIKTVPQSKAYVIERLGKYRATWEPGLNFKIPFIERIASKVSLKEHVVDFAPQPVITKDNVTMRIDAVVFFQVTDPKLYLYGVNRPLSAIEQLTATSLRNIIGELELDETLSSRDIINDRMRLILDNATDQWGIKVNRVEVKNIDPPADIKDAMEKQMRAERERRELITRAEGEKRSNILIAEGQKESSILKADGQKQAILLRAEAEAGKIIQLQKANAEAIRLINEASPSLEYMRIRAIEGLEKVANGQSTKIVVPSEIQNLAGLITSVSEIAKTDTKI